MSQAVSNIAGVLGPYSVMKIGLPAAGRTPPIGAARDSRQIAAAAAAVVEVMGDGRERPRGHLGKYFGMAMF
jgi:hypothetical protein